MSTIRFEGPPPPRSKHRAAAEALRGRPGEWAIVVTYETYNSANSTASRIKHGRHPSYRGRAWDAVARTVDGEHRVYARFIGVNGSTPADDGTVQGGGDRG